MNLDIQHLMRPGTLNLAGLPPLSLYIHLPWCLRKCPYCDFNSHEWRDESGQGVGIPEQAYLQSLRLDLEAALPLIWGRTVHTVFIGGGTPSLFSPAGIERLLSDVRSLLRLSARRKSPWRPTQAPSSENALKPFGRLVSRACRWVYRAFMIPTCLSWGECTVAIRRWLHCKRPATALTPSTWT